jgi:zinc transport system ATP-binding protein
MTAGFAETPQERTPTVTTGLGAAQAAVSFENVSVTLGGVSVLEGVSAVAPRGSSTALIGPNGAGKTTLLMALLGQIRYEGTIRVTTLRADGAARVGYVPQHFDFDRGMPLTVLEFMVMGKQRTPLWFGVRKRRRAEALEALKAVRVEHVARRRLGALSGGEIQRVLVALALQQDPDLLILDEPAAGVDIVGEHLLCELLESLHAERDFTQILVSHDLTVVTAHATHVICINHRLIEQGAPAEVLRPDVLEAAFGIHLGLPDRSRLHEAVSGYPAAAGAARPRGEERRHD